MADTGRIITICPADGWFAVFKKDDGKPDVKGAQPLACWALVEGGEVKGLADGGGFLDFVDEVTNFYRYRHRDDNDMTWG